MLGLPGYYLTTRDSMKDSDSGFKFNIYGPPGFNELMKTAKYFVGLLDHRVNLYDFDDTDMDTDIEESKEFPINDKNVFEDKVSDYVLLQI